jgi:hypothetical protein
MTGGDTVRVVLDTCGNHWTGCLFSQAGIASGVYAPLDLRRELPTFSSRRTVPTRNSFPTWPKAGSPAVSQAIESGHIGQTAFGISSATSPFNGYSTRRKQGTGGRCVPAGRAGTGADGVQRWSDISDRTAGCAGQAARFANRFPPRVVPQYSLAYPARTRIAPRHSSLRGTRRSFHYILSAIITMLEKPLLRREERASAQGT